MELCSLALAAEMTSVMNQLASEGRYTQSMVDPTHSLTPSRSH